ncbi:MAG: HAD family hydrolase [Syntrophales bacterium]|nr:HAD family hydrolase [Syntrophales bacterium]
MKRGAVFFDRDGTINEEVGYLSRMDQLILYPEAAPAIRMVNESGMKAVVVTNQSGVARGFFDEAFIAEVHDRINELLGAAGSRIDGFYHCPHHPEGGISGYTIICDCRKPHPGMLYRAALELEIDLGRSYMVGDTLKDIEAAERAGARGVLVRTGYGMYQPVSNLPAHIADNVFDAVNWILRNRSL